MNPFFNLFTGCRDLKIGFSVFNQEEDLFSLDAFGQHSYLGSSICPNREFEVKKLYALRLWQLQVLGEMEIAHHHMKPALPYPLEVTTLILMAHSTIAIRFRMDEKRFDVDGSYNARLEIVKMRLDKAHIKHTTERITQVGKITIVYASDSEEQEYVGYIRVLQSRNLLEKNVEKWEVEDLQGVSGLRALRVKIVHPESVVP